MPLPKVSRIAGAKPAALAPDQIGENIADGRRYKRDDVGDVVRLLPNLDGGVFAPNVSNPALRNLASKLAELGPSTYDYAKIKASGPDWDDAPGFKEAMADSKSSKLPFILAPPGVGKQYSIGSMIDVLQGASIKGYGDSLFYQSGPWQSGNPPVVINIIAAGFQGHAGIRFDSFVNLEGFTVIDSSQTIDGFAALVRQSSAKGKFTAGQILTPAQFGDPDALPYGGGFGKMDVQTVACRRGFDATFAEGLTIKHHGFYGKEANFYCGGGLNDSHLDLWENAATNGPNIYLALTAGIIAGEYVSEEGQGDGISLFKCSRLQLVGKNSHNKGYGIRIKDSEDIGIGGDFTGNAFGLTGADSASIFLDGDCPRIYDLGMSHYKTGPGVDGPNYIFKANPSALTSMTALGHLPKQKLGVFADDNARKYVRGWRPVDDTDVQLGPPAPFRKKFALVKNAAVTVDIPLSLPVAQYVDADPLQVTITHQTYTGNSGSNQFGTYTIWIGDDGGGPKAQATPNSQAGGDFAGGFDPASGVTVSMPNASTLRISIAGGASVGDGGRNTFAILTARRLSGGPVTGNDITKLAV